MEKLLNSPEYKEFLSTIREEAFNRLMKQIPLDHYQSSFKKDKNEFFASITEDRVRRTLEADRKLLWKEAISKVPETLISNYIINEYSREGQDEDTIVKHLQQSFSEVENCNTVIKDIQDKMEDSGVTYSVSLPSAIKEYERAVFGLREVIRYFEKKYDVRLL